MGKCQTPAQEEPVLEGLDPSRSCELVFEHSAVEVLDLHHVVYWSEFLEAFPPQELLFFVEDAVGYAEIFGYLVDLLELLAKGVGCLSAVEHFCAGAVGDGVGERYWRQVNSGS